MSRALSMIGPVMGLAAVLGPVLGGTLTEADVFGSSWRSVFLVNVPLGLATLALSGHLVEDRALRRPRLDVLGTVLAAAGIAALVYPLVQGPELRWPWWIWLCVAAGFVLLAVLVAHVRRSAAAGRDPLVEPTLFAGRGFPAALLTSFDVPRVPAVADGRHPRRGKPRWRLPLGDARASGIVRARRGAGQRPVLHRGARPCPSTRETGSAAGSLNTVQQLGGAIGVAALGTIAPGSGAAAAFVMAAVLVVAATVAATAMVTGGGDREAR